MSVSISYLESLNWDWLSESECVMKFTQAKKQGISIFMYSGWKSTRKHNWLRLFFSAQNCQQFHIQKPSSLYISTCSVLWLLEHLHGRQLHHIPGKSVPMLNNTFNEPLHIFAVLVNSESLLELCTPLYCLLLWEVLKNRLSLTVFEHLCSFQHYGHFGLFGFYHKRISQLLLKELGRCLHLLKESERHIA